MLALASVLLVLTSASPTLEKRDTNCAPLHIVTVRGSLSPLNGDSTLNSLVGAIKGQLPAADNYDLPYPALLDDAYMSSVSTGTSNLRSSLNTYAKLCPDSKLALLGYSQGAQVVMNTLCGDSDTGANPETNPAVTSMLSSVVVYGDPTRVQGQSYDQGDPVGVGEFTRVDPGRCDQFASKIQSYCNVGDPVCHNWVGDIANHVYPAYVDSSQTAAQQWVVKKYHA